MADYDVGVIGLSSPPPSAPLQQYRPAVSVRNNGIHDALASGVLRVYAAGRLIFTTELYSSTIAPGATRDALATDYWTPPAPGTYEIIADVNCPLDQIEPNNHLGPTAIFVTTEPPPPPPVVAYHAAQHEEGGADELIIDGLHGKTADPQTPSAHKATHQLGGSDAISVEGLPGILLQAQPIADHHSEHEDGGNDELNVDELSGVLKNLQKPKVHGNEAHDPNYATKPHGNSDHDPDFATQADFETHHDRHESTGDDAINVDDLDGLLAEHQRPGYIDMAQPPPVGAGQGATTVILEHTEPAGSLSNADTFRVKALILFYDPLPATPSIAISIKSGSDPLTEIMNLAPQLPNPSDAEFYHMHLDLELSIHSGVLQCAGHLDCAQDQGNVLRCWDISSANTITVTASLKIKATLTTPPDANCGASIKHSSIVKLRQLNT